jgi:hypothetical protein
MDFLDITISGTDGDGGLRRWEGTLAYLYLDSRKVNGVPAPLVTIGIGCAVGPASNAAASAEVLGLPWTVSGGSATAAQIQADYAAICAAPPGFVATHYQSITGIRLSDDAIVALCQSRLSTFVAALQHTFAGFDSWPDTCKAGALDLIYGLGVAGFQAYHHFIAACLQQDWTTAADQCASDANIPAYDARNAARKALFLAGLESAVS